MDQRTFAVAFFVAALLASIFVTTQAALALVAVSLGALLLGYRRKATYSPAVSAFFLYYPLAAALARFVPGPWGFVAAGGALILLSEKLSFEYHVSSSLEGPLGMDEESRELMGSLSKTHGARLAWFALLCTIVSLLASVASSYAPYLQLLAGAAVLLVFALWGYSRR